MGDKKLAVTLLLLSIAMFIATLYGVAILYVDTKAMQLLGLYDPQGQWIVWAYFGLSGITSIVGVFAAYEIGKPTNKP